MNGQAAPPTPQPRPGLAVQLGVHGTGPFGRRPEEDLPGVLALVAGAGYDGVEFHPNVAYSGPAEVSAALATAGLQGTGLHVFDDQLAGPAEQVRMIELAATAGCGRLILTAHTILAVEAGTGAPRPPAADRFRRVAELLTRLDADATAAGLTISYHPHATDFRPLPDSPHGGLDILLRHAPAAVSVALDLYWAHVGGADPAATLDRLGSRVDYVHVRDGNARKTSPLGRGEVPLDPALRLLATRRPPPAWLVYEDATPALPPTTLCRHARDYLADRGFADTGRRPAADRDPTR